MTKVEFKIVSGGQTGADRAALDWAIKHGGNHGGWCPKGRKAEDGPISARYLLKETPNGDYLQRTEWNVRDSDGTVIFTMAKSLTGGSKATSEFAAKHCKPCLHLSAENRLTATEELRSFVETNQIRVLNVAGTRGSKEPAVGTFVLEILDQVWRWWITSEKQC